MDMIYESIKTNGKFQKILTITIFCLTSEGIFLGASFPFLTRRPIFSCGNSDKKNNTFDICTAEQICGGEYEYEYQKNTELSVNNFSYDFDLYCDRSYYIGILGTVFFIGGMVGTIIMSPRPDRIGRKNVFNFMLICLLILEVNIFFVINPMHLVVIYFFGGMFQYAKSFNTILIAELLDRKYSGVLISVNNVMFPILGILIEIYFLLFNHWKTLIVILFISTVFTLYLALKYLVESPRWLVSKGMDDECYHTLEFMAYLNGTEKSFQSCWKENQKALFTSDNAVQEKKVFSIFQIIQFQSQRLKLIILSYCFFTCSFCYYGLVLNLDFLKGNFYVDCLLTFIAQAVSLMISGMAADKYGRLITLKVSGILGGVAFIFYELTPRGSLLGPVLIFITSFGFSATYNVIYICGPESFPTIIRSTCVGTLYLVSRSGASLVPLVSTLVPHSPFLFGVMSVIAAYLMQFLTETLGREIEDHIPEYEAAAYSKSLLSTGDA